MNRSAIGATILAAGMLLFATGAQAQLIEVRQTIHGMD